MEISVTAIVYAIKQIVKNDKGWNCELQEIGIHNISHTLLFT